MCGPARDKKVSGTEKRLSCINVPEMGSRHFIRPELRTCLVDAAEVGEQFPTSPRRRGGGQETPQQRET